MLGTSLKSALAAVACAVAVSPNHAQVLAPTYFGAHVHRSVPNSLWKQVGFGAIRLHDANVTWAELEPRQGEWKWARLDSIAANATKANVEILLPLQATPEWAASDPRSPGAYGNGANTAPARIEDWVAFVTAVVTRYKGSIAAYEIWNEPNLKQFFDGKPEQLAELTRAAASVIRSIDPGAKVVCASITGDYGVPWLKRYLANGTGRSCDVIGYHFYTKHKPPETMLPIMAAVRKTVEDAGVGALPLWNTETGWVIGITPDIDVKSSGFKGDVKILTPDEATAYIPRALLLGRYGGAERFYWYSWDHPSMGFSAGRGIKWTRPARLYADFRKWIEGANIEGCSSTDLVWNCQLSLANGETLGVFWRTEGNSDFVLPKGGDLYAISAEGDLELVRRVQARDVVRLGIEPMFLKGSS